MCDRFIRDAREGVRNSLRVSKVEFLRVDADSVGGVYVWYVAASGASTAHEVRLPGTYASAEDAVAAMDAVTVDSLCCGD